MPAAKRKARKKRKGSFLQKSPFSVQHYKPALQLPPEVLLQVFWHLDEHSYFVSLLTCKQFWVVGSARRVLIRQIHRIPGIRHGLVSLSTEDLFLEFRRRGTQAALGAGVLSDVKGRLLPRDSSIRQCAISSFDIVGTQGERISPSFLAIPTQSQAIQVFALSAMGVDLITTLSLHDFVHPGRSVCIKSITFGHRDRGDLVVLFEDQSNNQASCAYDPISFHSTYLIAVYRHCFDYLRSSQVDFCHSDYGISQLVLERNLEPTGVAQSSSGDISVAWIKRFPYTIGLSETDLEAPKGMHLLATAAFNLSSSFPCDMTSSLCSRLASLIPEAAVSTIVVFYTFSLSGLRVPGTLTFAACQIGPAVVCSLLTFADQWTETAWTSRELSIRGRFEYTDTPVRLSYANEDGGVLFYNAREPIHLGVATQPSTGSTISVIFTDSVSSVEVGFGRDGLSSQRLAVGLPFHTSYRHEKVWEDDEDETCVRIHLALACTGQPWFRSEANHLFIVRCIDYTEISHCNGHGVSDHTMDTVPDKRAVAVLAGWQRSDSTLGTRLAVSPDGRRIAAAMWNKVLIWTICPDLLYYGPLDFYFPARDYNAQKDLGRLRPIQLPSQGVIHELHWIDQWNLFGVADRGLAHWYIGHLSTGKRDTELDAN